MVEPKKLGWVETSRAWFDTWFQKIAWPNINPSIYTVLQVAPAICAALAYPNWLWVFIFLVIMLLFDLADGATAKKYKRTSQFGYYMDLFFDRLTEFIVLIPIIFFEKYSVWTLIFIFNVFSAVWLTKKGKHIIIPLRQAFAIYAFILIF